MCDDSLKCDHHRIPVSNPEWDHQVREAEPSLQKRKVIGNDKEKGLRFLKNGEKYSARVLENIAKDDIESALLEDGARWEGGSKKRFVNYYERKPKPRAAAVLIHGTQCKACGFDFEKVYGARGKSFIEVHHLRPVSSLERKLKIDPQKDMAVLCSNCHRMIHRKKDDVLTVDELRQLIEEIKKGFRSDN